ncbi:MAG: heme exporter protein CcmB [Saprospiraceae bacterium]|nr:heme exporter protein CcmB [Saprospiraceae bacterium]MBK8632825.1 heme exporter protein CcmB [Saprospiraceae bacterium]MBP7641712.1 heme exporter protein CcmB [Saprospiraceae bacterium]
MYLARIAELVRKDFLVEIRNAQTISAIVLFTLTVVFIVYKSFNALAPLQWNVMLWIVVLISSLNALVKSFSADAAKTSLFYYTLYHPTEVIVAKIVYNFMLTLVIFLIAYVAFGFFMVNPVKDFGLFIQGACLGLFGICTIFSFVSAIISSQESGVVLLMSVLALPLTIPCMLLLIKISSVSMRLMVDSSVGNDLLILAGIDILLVGLVVLLFGELWKS